MLKLKQVNVIDFVLYASARIFRGYLYALGFLALGVTIAFFAALKYMLLRYSPELAASENTRGFFQLSYFFFAPLCILFVCTKFRLKKYNEIKQTKTSSYTISLLTVVAISILLALLFTYILMIW